MEINILISKINHLILNPLINDYQNLKIKCFYEDVVNDVEIGRLATKRNSPFRREKFGNGDWRCNKIRQDAKRCQDDAIRTPENHQDAANKPPGWLNAIRTPGRCQDDVWVPPICRQKA